MMHFKRMQDKILAVIAISGFSASLWRISIKPMEQQNEINTLQENLNRLSPMVLNDHEHLIGVEAELKDIHERLMDIQDDLKYIRRQKG